MGCEAAKMDGRVVFAQPHLGTQKFTWAFEQAGKKQLIDGKYSVDGAVLVLKRTDGAEMPGLVTLAANGFNFKLYGGPPEDPGLDFRK